MARADATDAMPYRIEVIHHLRVPTTAVRDDRARQRQTDVRHDISLGSRIALGKPLARAQKLAHSSLVANGGQCHQIVKIHEHERVIVEVPCRARRELTPA